MGEASTGFCAFCGLTVWMSIRSAPVISRFVFSPRDLLNKPGNSYPSLQDGLRSDVLAR
jgi:hypothetical protein